MNTTRRFLSIEEATNVVNRIPCLIGMMEDVKYNPQDHKGFLYISRFNKDNFLDAYPEKEREQLNIKLVVSENVDEETKFAATVNHTTDSSHSLDRKRRFATSLCTLAAKPEKRHVIVAEGAIPILLELALMHDRSIQVKVAAALASLSSEASLRRQMLDDGSLAVLVSLATNCSIREVKINCCRTICNLCCVPNFEHKMVKEGVPLTVNHVAMACPEATDLVLQTLLNLSCVAEKFSRIEDITEALMYFMSTPITPDQEMLVLQAFCNLSGVRSNQLRLVEDGALKVVEKFYHNSNPRNRKMACEILKNLTADTRTRTKLLELNIIHLLLEISTDDDIQIKMQCAKAFQYLAIDVAFRQKIINSNALGLIIASSANFPVIEMGQIAAKTLKILCNDTDIAAKLVQSGVGEALVSLLNSDDQLINQYCVESVCALFRDMNVLKQLVAQGADAVIVTVASNTTNPLTLEWCSFALFRLAGSKVISRKSLEQLVVPCIINMCENSNEATKKFCSAAISHISMLNIVDCSVAIPLLVNMLRHESSEIVRKHCASSLFNLADKDENCYLMLDSGALLPIVELTLTGRMLTKVICAGIISRLSLHKQYYSQFATGNVLKVLLELSCVDHRLTQRRVVIALSNLSQDEDLRAQLLQLNPIPYIISLASERDEYLRRGCISIVCNMSYNEGSEQTIVKAGIVPTLMITALITSDQIVSKVICVKAIINLMAEKSLYPHLVKDGVVWGLSKLVQSDDDELVTLSAKALCCFSAAFSREILNSQVALDAVILLIDRPELELKKSGARMLTNILLKTTDADKDFRKKVVANMRAIARCNDPELDVMCVLCLCLASQSESCRATIVESGMLKLIDGNTIFSDPTISFAYITMFSNIANNPLMRTKVLDDRVVDRFLKICVIKDTQLDIAIAKALYCVSCAAENIPRLVDQNIIGFIKALLDPEQNEDEEAEEDPRGVADEVVHHLIACMYNISTVPAVQNRVISEGYVSLMLALWPIAQKDYKMCCLAFLSMCHLACGHTNSSRMVRENCSAILTFITAHAFSPAYASYSFGTDMFYRCSAAIRNLLSVVNNQKIMVDAGVIECLLQIADRYVGTYIDEAQGGLAHPSTPKKRKYDSHYAIQVNCATALKSMTYNKEIRDKLVSSGAINIILEDMKKDGQELPMSQALLCELEAESWDNGARGKVREGRVTNVKPAAMFTDFLGGTSNVKLDVEMKPEKLNKFYVQVMLDEPSEQAAESKAPEMQSTASEELLLRSSVPSIRKARRKSTITIQGGDDAAPKSPDNGGGSGTSAHSGDGGSSGGGHTHSHTDQKTSDAQEEEELSMAALAIFPDNEEGSNIANMIYPKMDFNLTAEEVIWQFEHSKSRIDGFNQGNEEDNSEYTPVHQDSTGSDTGTGTANKSLVDEKPGKSLPALLKSSVVETSSPPAPKTKSSMYSSNSASNVATGFPPLPGSREGERKKSVTGTLNYTKKVVVSNPNKKFDKLLDIIHKSRDASRKNKIDTRSGFEVTSENIGVEAVVDEWRKFSQF